MKKMEKHEAILDFNEVKLSGVFAWLFYAGLIQAAIDIITIYF
tara:strand:- start:1181 stop:1309 length:129 start_codon:yes stop_codon:yes gene_type:complete